VRGGARPARVLEERLRLGAGFGAEERGHVLEICPTLSRHLAHWSPEQVDLEISVKNRGGRELKVPLQAWLPRWPSLVATSTDRELDHALIEVYNDMIRQIEDGRTKRELGKPRRRGGARLTAALTGSGANVSRYRATLAVKSHPLGRELAIRRRPAPRGDASGAPQGGRPAVRPCP
jgi:hypothetical protein